MKHVVICAVCVDCGAVEIKVRDIVVRKCENPRIPDIYRIACPDCALKITCKTDSTMSAMLLRAGAQIERWAMPKELDERRDNDSAPITHDDLIEFHASLAALPTARRDRSS